MNIDQLETPALCVDLDKLDGFLDTMNAGLPYTALERTVPIHPTVSELIPTLLLGLAPPAN